MNFKDQDILQFAKRINPNNLKLDHDEKYQSFKLLNNVGEYPKVIPVEHLEKFHVNPDTCNPTYMPPHTKGKLIQIIEEYTKGYCELQDNKWVDLVKAELVVQR